MSDYSRYEWQQIAAPKLSGALPNDACFSTAFSPSGHICAVGAQGGTITVFATNLIHGDMEVDDAVIDIFATSRRGRDPDDMVGAVRSMAFGPEPWDLFAWAEDQGRVCVADLRDCFTSRQTIELDVSGTDVERADLLDFEDDYTTAEQRELEIEARFVQRQREALDAQDHLAAVNHAADYMELAAERRRLQRELQEIGQSTAFDLNPHGLTESERQILLRLERQRAVIRGRERQDPEGRAFSINYSSTGDMNPRPTTLGSSSGNTSIRQYMRERNIERNLDRGLPRAYQARRQGSIVISNSNSSNTPSSSQPSLLAPIGTTAATISTSPSRIPSATADTNSTRPASSSTPPPSLPIPTSTTDPWHTISAAMAASSATTVAFDTMARLRLERERDLENLRRMREREREATEASVANFERRIQQSVRAERFRTNRLRQLRDGGDDTTYDDYELDVLGRLAWVGRRNEGTGVTTMGIGWSKDGALLYVGTEEGILEYRVNIQERKMFPAVAFR